MRAHLGLAIAAALGTAIACSSSPTSAPPPSTAPPVACDLDPALTADECTALESMALPAALPPSPANAHADNADAAYLGFIVFFDARFSSNQNVRCVSCHFPENNFDDAKPTSTGLTPVVRNSPSAINVARQTVFFWDGRADSLWSQPLFAFENPKEMGFTRLEVAHRLARTFSNEYAAAFGPLPAMDDATRFPAAGKPGDAAWDQMAKDDQDTVNRVVANAGKAIEAYMRKLAAGPGPFDRFLSGQKDALTDGQRRGMVAFVRQGCTDCHSGPLLSDEKFHNLGVPAWPGVDPDRGRVDGVTQLLANPFNLDGPYVDGAPAPVTATAVPSDLGAFRTPTLRNVAITDPYAHNGRFATLADVIAFHQQGGGRGPAPADVVPGQPAFVGDVDAKLVARDASPQTVQDLVDFMSALTGMYPPAPWNNWPSKN